MKTHLAVSVPQIEDHNTLEEFIASARARRVEGWTATRKFEPGDLVLFYFSEPVKSVVGIGLVAAKTWDEEGRFFWTKKSKVTFCDFEPVRLLKTFVSLEQVAQSARLRNWYVTRPYRNSREIEPEVARILLDEIIRLNPQVRSLVKNRENRVSRSKPQSQRRTKGDRRVTKTWRMSFRCGDRGYEMWPHCYALGVAAITYWPLREADLSQDRESELELWAQLEPSQKASLRRVAYEMKKGDVIYVKQGPRIVGRGKVKGPYQFDSHYRLVDPRGIPWAHQVPVDWEPDFQPVDILLGAEPLTVLELSGERLEKLEAAVGRAKKHADKYEALEGEVLKREAVYRKRNKALIEAKKANSDGRCEVCEFSFEERYGLAGRDCLIAHHMNPMAHRSKPSKTSLDDIALLCPNCHAMAHTQDPPFSLEELRKKLRKH